MTFIDNEADLLAEHQAAKEAAEAARRAEEEREYEAIRAKQREAEQAARAKRVVVYGPIYDAIAAAVAAEAGWACQHDGDLHLKVTHDGYTVNADYQISIDHRRERVSSYRSRETDQLQVTVSGSERKVFPQKKDKSFSYDKIADVVRSWASWKISGAKAEANKKANAEPVAFFRADHPGLSDYYGAMRVFAAATTDPGRPLMVKLDVTRAMSYDDAHAIYEVLVARGLIKKEG